MSRIYFHTPTSTAEVRGNERAHFGVFCSNLAWFILKPYAELPSPPLACIFPSGHYVHHSSNFAESARIAFSVGTERLTLGERQIDPFVLSLNTALSLGNDTVRLAARIHGQCEIHCWASGQNRKWLAGIVRQGVASCFYRSGMGWDSVIELLESDSAAPVVLSYSVCDGFPNKYVSAWTPPTDEDGEPDYDAWYDLPTSEQWRLAFDGLAASGGGLELSPAGWTDYYFGDGYTAMNLADDLMK